MLYIGENLKRLRKERDFTQEEAAEMLGVSAQSVSKWERGDTYPDIGLLPALANLYKISLDALIGMDKINDAQARNETFAKSREFMQNGDTATAIALLENALSTFPNDEGFMAELSFALALNGGKDKLLRAIKLSERVLGSRPSEKVRHTTRAALSFMYLKSGERDKAMQTAHNLPHIRESREKVLAEFNKNPDIATIDAYMRFIVLGDRGAEDAVDRGEQDIIVIELGLEMIRLYSEYDLAGRIGELRNELAVQIGKMGHDVLPPVRIRDNKKLAPNHVRMRYLADYLIDGEYAEPQKAVDEIIMTLRKVAMG
ncbi:MAG: helix-turn-helix domain-containing protein [Defluviitaleaceae bacterium]|nr:helix-turn-helix domain-containing protein [Defluviitaleaceae bacterium]